MQKRGPKTRYHKSLKTYASTDDLTLIREYLAKVKHAQRLTDRSAATVRVLLKARELGLLLESASMQ